MACLSIISNNPNFSFILNKNPNNGMKAKIIRKGYMFGWYSSESQYNLTFFEGNDEVSFPKVIHQEFAYLDCAQYNSPSFIFVALTNFLTSALNKLNDLDIPYDNSICLNSVVIKKTMFDRIINYFPNYHFDIISLDDCQDNYKVIISGKTTIHELLNLTYLFAFFFIIWDNINLTTDKSLIKRLIRAANIIDAPYYIRYLIKIYAIHKDNFNEFKEELEQCSSQKINMLPDNNQQIRLNAISPLLSYNKHIVDFGAGEGAFIHLSKQLQDKNYYAIDKNKYARQIIQSKIKKHEWSNISVSETLNISEPYEVIITEVFEHNELKEITDILNRFWNDINCSKIILTTPNREFNQFYLLGDNLRHKDHKFEMTKNELIDYFKQVPNNWTYKIQNLGDEVNDISTTFLVVMERN